MTVYLENNQTNSDGFWPFRITFHLLLHIGDPFFTLLFNFFTFEPKMSTSHLKKKSTVRLKTHLFTLDTNLFKTRSRIANLFEHCPLDGGLSDIDVIVTGIFISWRGSAWSLISRLVEVRLRNENQRLDRHKDLKQAWCVWVPFLFRSTVPCVEQRETNFAVNVKVRIETNSVLSSCGQMYFHWRQRIVRWEMDVEFKAAIPIRRVTRTCNQNLKISTKIQINRKS